MKRLLILKLSVVTLAPAIAQKTYSLNFGKAELYEWPWSFGVDSIIDARSDKKLAGFAYKGFPKSRRVAKIKTPLADDLYKIVQETTDGKSFTKNVILRINHLYVYEIRHQGKYGVAELNLSFIEKIDGRYYEVFQSSEHFSIKGGNMAKWHPQNIIDALADSFDDFEERLEAGRLSLKPIQNGLDQNPYEGKRLYPIQIAKQRPKAIYHSFYDFRDNFPDTNLTFYPDYHEKEDQLDWATLDFPNQDVDPTNLYAFSDGERLFIRGGKKFYEIKDSADHFHLDRHAISYNGYTHGMILSGLLFGPVGVALYAANSTPRGSEDGYVLDLNLGKVLPYRMNEIREVNGTITIYNASDGDAGENVKLSIGGDTCTLKPNDYYYLEVEASRPSFNICVEANGEKLCYEISNFAFWDDVYVTRVTRKGKLKFLKIHTDQKEGIVKRINDGEISIGCPSTGL